MNNTNPYTIAMDGVHAPESAVENAVMAAERRAAQMAKASTKARHAAVAVSVLLLAGAAVAVSVSFGKGQPPVKPLPVGVSEKAAGETVPGMTDPTQTPETVYANGIEAPRPSFPGSIPEYDENHPSTEPAANDTNAFERPVISSETAVPETALPRADDGKTPQPATVPTPPPEINVTEPSTEPPYQHDDPAQPEPTRPVEKNYCYAYVKSSGALYCCIEDDDGCVLGDPDLYSIEHLAETVYSYENDFSLVRWSPDEHGIKLTPGYHRYYFVSESGEEVFADYLYVA